MRLFRAAIGLAAASTVLSGAAAGDDAGREAFSPCRACHSLKEGAEVMAGPSLFGLIGRAVGGDPGLGYSPVLRAANAEGLVWTPQRLDTFLADPDGMFPGMWMSYPGIRDKGERAALAQFIAAASNREPSSAMEQKE